jgi:osmoprotectant transport system substrate-binding protein
MAVAIALTGCTTGGSSSTPTPPGLIVIGSFDFPESEVLASVYGQALKAKGFPVRLLQGVGTRELLEPALSRGLIGFLPEYLGSSLDFVSLGSEQGSPDPKVLNRALARVLSRWGVMPLASSPAQNVNAVVVSRSTAQKYGLHSVSDLAGVAPTLVFGGPPECPHRDYCMRGLKGVYGIAAFKEFIPLDAGGPITLSALRSGQIDVGLLFSTDPALEGGDLVPLDDDRQLQPADNVTPVVRADLVKRYGERLVAAVDEVSSRLTTEGLRSLNAQLLSPGAKTSVVARRWLQDQGLV